MSGAGDMTLTARAARRRTPTRADAERDARLVHFRTCVHESAHAVACVVYGVRLGFVSTRPGLHYRGITTHDAQLPPGELQEGGILSQSIAFRAAVERNMVMTLAGPLAAMMVDPASLPARYGVSDDDQAVRDLAALLASRSPLSQALALSEADDPVPTDHDRAYGLSWALSGEPVEASGHYQMLRAAARRFVIDHERPIVVLARALARRIVIDGPDAERIIRRAMKTPALKGKP